MEELDIGIEIGIPKYLDITLDNGMKLSELLALLESGSPLNNLPPRPVREIMLEKHKDEIGKAMASATGCLIGGYKERAKRILNSVATKIPGWIGEIIGNPNYLVSNALTTIKAKGGRNTPLVDTGTLKRSIKGYVKEQ